MQEDGKQIAIDIIADHIDYHEKNIEEYDNALSKGVQCQDSIDLTEAIIITQQIIGELTEIISEIEGA
jgi:UDP-N-acetylmuramoylalanine-D-glutamate ligase